MLKSLDDITGVILVGGKSRRMGRDKAFLEVGGKTLFERVLEAFRENFSRILLVGDRAERFVRYALPVYADLYPGSALGGLYTGLHYAETDHVFVSSCDLAFPSSGVIRHLCSLTGACDAVVPKFAHGYEPLFAAYSKNCLVPMKSLLEERNYCVYDVYPQLKVRDVAGDELEAVAGSPQAFLNLNTPEEYEAVKEKDHA